MLEIKEYFSVEDKEYWLSQIAESDWGAGKFLYKLLKGDRLKEICGENTRVLMLTEDKKLMAFCTLAEKDDVQPTELKPWVGFVYTYPEFRGNGCAGQLLTCAEELALKENMEYVYISTNLNGFYEKYGYQFWRILKDIDGEDSRIYRKRLSAT